MTDEVVNEQVEQTTETESTPVETQAEQVTEEAPVSETTDSEKVSKEVPYERFSESRAELRSAKDEIAQLKEMVAAMYQTPKAQEPVPELDPDAQAAVDYRINTKVNEIVAQQRVAEFRAKHDSELKKDPLLQATVEAEMRKQNAQGLPIMPEKAYEEAKSLIESRLNAKVEEAKQEGVKEGQDIAKTKQQLGAVGETGKLPQKDESQLTAEEFAKLHNIPRSI